MHELEELLIRRHGGELCAFVPAQQSSIRQDSSSRHIVAVDERRRPWTRLKEIGSQSSQGVAPWFSQTGLISFLIQPDVTS